jgi:hypothetical protein
VRRDALLGDAVHVLGPNLDLERHTARRRPPTCAATDTRSAAASAMKSLNRPGTGDHIW